MEGSKIVDVKSRGFKVSVLSNCKDHYLVRRLVEEVLEENSSAQPGELNSVIEKKLRQSNILIGAVCVIKG